jgi:hypothetical protein
MEEMGIEMRDIAEKLILRAIENGTFRLPRQKGKPIKLEENLHHDPSKRFIFQVLKNAGMKPLWLECEIEIREKISEAHSTVFEAANLWDQEGIEWERAVHKFTEQIEEINGLIQELNLKVPLPRFQRSVIDPHKALEKALENLAAD